VEEAPARPQEQYDDEDASPPTFRDVMLKMVVLGGCVTLFMPGLALGVTAAVAEALMPTLHTASGIMYSVAGYMGGGNRCMPQKDSHATDPVDSRWDKLEYRDPLPIYVARNVCIANAGVTENPRVSLYDFIQIKDSSCVDKVPDRFNVRTVPSFESLSDYTYLKGNSIFVGCEIRLPIYGDWQCQETAKAEEKAGLAPKGAATNMEMKGVAIRDYNWTHPCDKPDADFSAVFVNRTGACDNIAHFLHDSLWDVLTAGVRPPTDLDIPDEIHNFVMDTPGSVVNDLYKWKTANATEWIDYATLATYDVLSKKKGPITIGENNKTTRGALNWVDEMVESPGRVMCFENLVYTGWNFRHLMLGDTEQREDVASAFRSAMLNRLGLNRISEYRCPSKVAIYGRGDRHNRKLLNADEVEEHILATTNLEVSLINGFYGKVNMSCGVDSHETCGEVEGIDGMKGQVNLYASSDVFILPYGAAMTNVVFMSRGATVIETSPMCMPASWPSKQKICDPLGNCWTEPGIMDARGLHYFHVGGNAETQAENSCWCPPDVSKCPPEAFYDNFKFPLTDLDNILEQIADVAAANGCPPVLKKSKGGYRKTKARDH